MNPKKRSNFPKWLFAVLAIGGLLTSGIYIGILSVESYTVLRLAQAIGFGVFGLLMFWGAYSKG